MYSLTRVWIGAKLGQDADPGQRRRQDDQRERQAVDAELVLDAEERDPVDVLDELEARPRRRGSPTGEQRATRPTRRAQSPSASDARGQRDGEKPITTRPDERQEVTKRRSGGQRSSSVSCASDHEVRAGHDDQPERDAEGVVLDAAGLDAARARAPAPRGRRAPMPLTVPSMTFRSNHQRRVREPAADHDEQQVVEVVEPPLVERGAVEERHARWS